MLSRDGLLDADTSAIESYRYALHAGPGVRRRLHDGLQRLPALLVGCHHVSVSTTGGCGSWEGVVASDDTARRAEDLQHLLDEGPTLQALRTGHSVLCHDLGSETRWSRWCDHATTKLTLGAALAYPLQFHGRLVGALTLYSDGPRPLSDVDFALLHALAAPLSAVVAEARLDGHRTSPAA